MIVGAAQDVIKVKDGHVSKRVIVLLQPVVYQPQVKGARVFGM